MAPRGHRLAPQQLTCGCSLSAVENKSDAGSASCTVSVSLRMRDRAVTTSSIAFCSRQMPVVHDNGENLQQSACKVIQVGPRLLVIVIFKLSAMSVIRTNRRLFMGSRLQCSTNGTAALPATKDKSLNFYVDDQHRRLLLRSARPLAARVE
jgi:hypothetical protein